MITIPLAQVRKRERVANRTDTASRSSLSDEPMDYFLRASLDERRCTACSFTSKPIQAFPGPGPLSERYESRRDKYDYHGRRSNETSYRSSTARWMQQVPPRGEARARTIVRSIPWRRPQPTW